MENRGLWIYLHLMGKFTEKGCH